ncbi:pectin lyase fold/virulence factor [Xylariales sp. PMI_506]|nr:pectin lyase fold/virulence factor [Xylariales sp. PMI_506]
MLGISQSVKQVTVAFLAFWAITDARILDTRGYVADAIFVPPQPNTTAVAISNVYKVDVRPSSHNLSWVSVPLYVTPVTEINATTGSGKMYPSQFGIFDYEGKVDVSITPNASQIPTLSTVRVRPLSYGIVPTVSNGKISFSLSHPQDNIVVEVNGDVFNVVQLFTAEIERAPIVPEAVANDSSIVYYKPGYYDMKEPIYLQSGQTLYLAAGAWLKYPATNGDAIIIANATNVKIRGRGYLGSAVSIINSTDVSVEGAFTAVGGFVMAVSKRVHLSGWRVITSHTWGDGIDLFCMQDVLLEKLFIRSSDDSIALYQHRWDYYGDSKNITIQDASLWADVAHPINIGTHGNPLNPETMDGVTVRNVDILDHREPQIDYQGAIAFTIGDENLIKNVLIENVRVEDFRWGMLMSIRAVFNTKYNTAAGRGLENLLVRNLTYTNSGKNVVNPMTIQGYGAGRAISFVDFQGLIINGQHIWDGMRKPSWYQTTDFVPAIVGSYVNNLTFSA